MGTSGAHSPQQPQVKNVLTCAAIEGLLREQIAEWPLAAANYEALRKVRIRSFEVDGMEFRVQFNPARAVSSGAKVDAVSIKARPCFLCEDNRPEEQRGLSYDGYTVLVNPFPIFPRHFTVPAIIHTPQSIYGRIADMMRIAGAVPGYVVFYNGPRCGASAPDHAHFQIGNLDFLTLPDELARCSSDRLCDDGDAALYVACGLPMGVFVIDTPDIAAGQRLFHRVYDALPRPVADEEPMMNILCYAKASGICVVVIPRVKHRPVCYGVGEPGKMMISPASVDVGGVFITPVENDFKAIDADVIKTVLSEVCMSPAQIRTVVERMKL